MTGGRRQLSLCSSAAGLHSFGGIGNFESTASCGSSPTIVAKLRGDFLGPEG
jgi:hypothetical protein